MAAKFSYSEEQMAQLSDEERAGMMDPDLLDDAPTAEAGASADGEGASGADAAALQADPAAASATAAQEGEKPAEGAEVKEPEAGLDPKQPDAPPAAQPDPAQQQAAAQAAAEPTPAVEWKVDNTPAYQLPPEDAENRLKSIDQLRDELSQKFDDGALTHRELREQMKPLDQQERELRDQIMVADHEKRTALNEFKKVTVPSFMNEHAEYANGSPLYHALDREVRKLQGEQPLNPFDKRILEEAHRRVRDGTLKALGIDPATVKGGKAPAADAAAKAAAAAAASRQIPPSLANLPASNLNEAGTVGRFAHLDRLGPAEHEAALMKMSEADRELYLSGA
jgi:hypothetical protein